MSKRIEVDFNMYDRGCFVATSEEPLAERDIFTAYDVEGHEMVAIVQRVEEGLVYFQEVSSASVQLTGAESSPRTWTYRTQSSSWTVRSGNSTGLRIDGNTARSTVDA